MHGEEEGDQLGLEPASDKGDRLDGRLVQPLGVVEEIEAGLFGNSLGKERQDGEPHEEEIRRVATVEPERRLQRCPLPVGQRVEPVEERSAELVDTCEGKVKLGFDAA